LPIHQLERKSRVERGPFQPKLELYPRTKFGSTVRSFNKSWFDNFEWLEYSPKVDKAFCFPCRLFNSSDGLNKGQIDFTFSRHGFKNWNKATTKFKDHQKSKSHIHSMTANKNFLSSKSIDIALDESRIMAISQREKERLHNRSVLVRLIDITLCLAKSGKPFRGHNEQKSNVCKGMFLDFVSVLKKYDETLRNHIDNGKKNVLYTSNLIQNDLLKSINNVMKHKISSKIKNKLISVCADETSDVGHHEQMSVVVRFFDPSKNKPTEIFIGLQRLHAVDASSIFNSLTEKIKEINVDWSSVLAVCFDGAATLSGKNNGVQAKIKIENPQIQYIHCYGHCLNLVLVDSLGHKNRVVFDFFGCVQMIFSFVEGSPIRHSVLEKISQQTNNKLKTLKSLSTTRWACRSEAIEAVDHNYDSLIQCLSEIYKTTKLADVRLKANGLIHNLKSFNFIFALTVLKPILIQIRIVSAKLQSPDLDLLAAVSIVEALKKSLTDLRTDEDNYSTLFDKVLDICSSQKIEIPNVKQRKVSSRIDSNNTQHFTSDKKTEMKCFVYYTVLDDLLNGLEERFSQETLLLISAIGRLLQFKLHEQDLILLSNRFNLNDSELEAELRLLKSLPEFEIGKTSKTIYEWLNNLSTNNLCNSFQNIYKILTLFVTMPVTSCSCERSFSKLSLVKTKLRSCMTQDRLESMMLVFVEQELASELDPEDIIEEFKHLNNTKRRLEL